MRIILVGGGETIETIYYLARQFVQRGHRLSIINPSPAEAQMLSRRVRATIILGDASDPRILEEAGARQADVVLSLLPYDPDNLVTCQIAHKLYGVPRTLALVNDPDNEPIFRQLGISEVVSVSRIIGSLIEGQTIFDEITHLFPVDEGRLYVTELALDEEAPGVGRHLRELALPPDCLVACVLRHGEVIVPGGNLRLEVEDHLILITLPEHEEQALRVLAGERA